MKAYTDLDQSKKLAEILPLESADMSYWEKLDGFICVLKEFESYCSGGGFSRIPCWSLAALLEILDYPQLSKDKLGGEKEGWMVSVYPNNCRYDSYWHDNPVDACYEMILKLHKLHLL